jgi:peroxiredoxin
VPLSSELAAFKQNYLARVPAERARLVQKHIDQAQAQHVERRALAAGAAVTDFALPNQHGALVRLSERLQRGPLILCFYRGGWCPYCSLELRAYQRLLPDIEKAGATLLAVSPQTPDASLSTAQKNELQFDVLSDAGARVAESFGLVFTLPQELQELYVQLGIAVPQMNGDDSWRLPLPGTFVIGRDARIVLSYADADYRVRLEPEQALAAARSARA